MSFKDIGPEDLKSSGSRLGWLDRAPILCPKRIMETRYPAIRDLRRVARRRIPHFVWEYLDSATGAETGPQRNRAALDQITLMPSVLHGEPGTNLATTVLGQDFAAPFGIAPVGMSGLIWPGAEVLLAQEAARAALPYTLSTVATVRPEAVGGLTGGRGWFQLYPPRDETILADMLARVRDAGFGTLVLTLDVPAASRRERQTRGGLQQPPRITPRLALQVARRPVWGLKMARQGLPRMAFIDDYAGALAKTTLPSTAHAGYVLRTAPDRAYLDRLRKAWDGPLIAKGVLDPAAVPGLEEAGVDAIWVSNHAGRQFDGGPAPCSCLPAMRAATALPLIADGDVRDGLDILRLIAVGADFVMMGRPWHYALGALDAAGPAHLTDILTKDITANLAQIGCVTPAEARDRLC